MNELNFRAFQRKLVNTPLTSPAERVHVERQVGVNSSGQPIMRRECSILETVTIAGASVNLTTTLPPGSRVSFAQRKNVGAVVLTTAVKLGIGNASVPAAYLLSSKEMVDKSGIATGDTQAAPTAGLDVAIVNAVFACPVVDSTGSGNFTVTFNGITTGAIVYSATIATLISHINTALDAAFGTAAIVASGGSLAALIFTCSGNGYTGQAFPVPTFTLTTGTQFTIGPATVTTAGSRSTSTTLSLNAVDTSGAAAGSAAGTVQVLVGYSYVQAL